MDELRAKVAAQAEVVKTLKEKTDKAVKELLTMKADMEKLVTFFYIN